MRAMAPHPSDRHREANGRTLPGAGDDREPSADKLGSLAHAEQANRRGPRGFVMCHPAAVVFDPPGASADEGKAVVSARFTKPGEYVLRRMVQYRWTVRTWVTNPAIQISGRMTQ